MYCFNRNLILHRIAWISLNYTINIYVSKVDHQFNEYLICLQRIFSRIGRLHCSLYHNAHSWVTAYTYFRDYNRTAKSWSELTGTRSLQLRNTLGYAICVKYAIWFEPMSFSNAGETGHSYGLPIPLEQPRVSSLDVDICRHTDAHEYIFIVSWIQICGKTYTKIYT